MPIIENTPITLAVWAMIGYAIGSIPFGILIARFMNLGDLRQIGSGNIGATNVLRTGNKLAAALTLLFDAAKGAVIVILARALAGEDAAHVAAFAAMIGHCYPLWLDFKGGKGVATFLGIVLALDFTVGLVCCAAWLVGAGLSRISSMGALCAASASTFAVVLLGNGNILTLCILLTMLVFWRHRANISRIKAGTETKIGQKT